MIRTWLGRHQRVVSAQTLLQEETTLARGPSHPATVGQHPLQAGGWHPSMAQPAPRGKSRARRGEESPALALPRHLHPAALGCLRQRHRCPPGRGLSARRGPPRRWPSRGAGARRRPQPRHGARRSADGPRPAPQGGGGDSPGGGNCSPRRRSGGNSEAAVAAALPLRQGRVRGKTREVKRKFPGTCVHFKRSPVFLLILLEKIDWVSFSVLFFTKIRRQN